MFTRFLKWLKAPRPMTPQQISLERDYAIVGFKLGRAAAAAAMAETIKTGDLSSQERYEEELLKFLSDIENFTNESGADIREMARMQGHPKATLDHIESLRHESDGKFRAVAGFIIEHLNNSSS